MILQKYNISIYLQQNSYTNRESYENSKERGGGGSQVLQNSNQGSFLTIPDVGIEFGVSVRNSTGTQPWLESRAHVSWCLKMFLSVRRHAELASTLDVAFENLTIPKLSEQGVCALKTASYLEGERKREKRNVLNVHLGIDSLSV